MYYQNHRRLVRAVSITAIILSAAGSATAFPTSVSNLLSLKTLGVVEAPVVLGLSQTPSAAPSPPSLLALPGSSALDPFSITDAWRRAWTSDPTMQFTDWAHILNVAQLAEFDVPLRSDPAERTNILLAAAAVDNVTVAPGRLFSFNDIVGERTPERGFQDGWMFDQGKLVRGSGGGICLVATGLYNAALNAGLGLVERHPHSGLVSYAPPGCDASVVYGAKDLKFKNTTSACLTIRTVIEPDRVRVKLFGATPPAGYQVILKPVAYQEIPYTLIEKPDSSLLPGQVIVDQKPRLGFDITLERVITQNGKVIRREVVASERRDPRNKIVRIAMQPQSPLTDPFLNNDIPSLPAPTHNPPSSVPAPTPPSLGISPEDGEN